MNYSDSRAPLELTKSSSRQKVLVCPYCGVGRYTSINTVGVVCSKCKRYFSSDQSLDESEADNMVNQVKPINTAFTKIKADMERKAYEWKDAQEGKEKRKHEPPEW